MPKTEPITYSVDDELMTTQTRVQGTFKPSTRGRKIAFINPKHELRILRVSCAEPGYMWHTSEP
jgi:hypothetical protein